MATYTICPSCGETLHSSEITGRYCSSCGATWGDNQEGGDSGDIACPNCGNLPCTCDIDIPEPDPEPDIDIPDPDIPSPDPDIPNPDPDYCEIYYYRGEDVYCDEADADGFVWWEMVTSGSSYTIVSYIPERYGYVFKGWATSPSSSTVKYNPGAKISKVTSSIDLYPVWEKVTEPDIPDPEPDDEPEEVVFYVDYDYSYADTSDPDDPGFRIIWVKAGTTHTIIECPASSNIRGGSFLYWQTSMGDRYDPGDVVIIDSDLSLSAVWGESPDPEATFCVEYDYAGANVDDPYDIGWKSISVTEGSTHTIIECPGSSNIYGGSFLHWIDNGGGIYNPGDKIVISGDLYLTAIWDKSEDEVVTTPVGPFTLRIQISDDNSFWIFDYYRGDQEVTVTHSPFKLRDALCHYEGLDFVGWTTEKGSTNIVGQYAYGRDSQGEYFYLVDVNSDMTLYPVWGARQVFLSYWIGYDAYCPEADNDGYIWFEGHSEGEPVTITSYIPQKSGYTFVGWSRYADATSPDYLPGDVMQSIDSDMDLYAVYKKSTSGHVYLKNGGHLVKGCTFVKVQGSHRRGVAVFTKVNGRWKRSTSV